MYLSILLKVYSCYVFFLIRRTPKSPDFQIPHGIAVLADGIIGVALNRINSSVLHFLDNANMIGVAGQTVRGPVKETQSKKMISPGFGI